MPSIIKNYCASCDHPKLESNSSIKKRMDVKLTDKALRRDMGPTKWEKKYPIVYRKVSTIDDVKKAINDVSEHANIQVLWHLGHGCEEGFQLGEDEDIDRNNIGELKEDYDKLNPTATIVFSACKIAKGDLARNISEVTEKRVIAATISTNPYSIKIKMKKEAKISIQSSRWGSERKNFKQKVQDFGSGLMVEIAPSFIGKHFKKDGMHVYENGILQEDRSHYVTV